MTTPSQTVSGNVIVVAAAVVFLATLGAVVAIALAIEDGARVTSLLGLILPSCSAVILGLLALFKLTEIKADVATVKADTTDLTNGKMDAKIRAGIADVLANHLIDPEAREQIDLDRLVRDIGNVDQAEVT